MKTKSCRGHNLKYEGPGFEDFIISSLKDEMGDENVIIAKHDSDYDVLLKNGISGYTNKEIYVEIKYGNNLAIIPDAIVRFKKNKSQSNFCIVGLWEEERTMKDGTIILGRKFIHKLIEKHNELWWCFAGEFDENAKIELSNDGKFAMLVSDVLGFKGFPTRIKLDEINKISEANEHEFLRLIKNEHMKPAIFAGNGISIPFGSDPWEKLSNNLYDYLFPYYIDNPKKVKQVVGSSTYAITSISKNTLQDCLYSSAIKNAIYRKYIQNKMHSKNTLLYALASAKCKHINLPIVTYNYDCFLEDEFNNNFPHFPVKSVYSYKQYNRTVEPKILHIHGFIPQGRKKIGKIILTDEEYFAAYRRNGWVLKTQSKILDTHVCLFIGSSMSDVFQMSMIQDARLRAYKSNKKNPNIYKYWKCFALMCFKGLSDKDKLSVINHYLKKRIHVIFRDDFSFLPDALNKLMNF